MLLWLSFVLLFVTPWTGAHQDPLSMGFPRQEYGSRLPFLSPGDLPNPGIEPMSTALQAGFLLLDHRKALQMLYGRHIHSRNIFLAVY